MSLATLDLDKHLPVTLTAPNLNEREFLELCGQFPECTLEVSSDGTVSIMPPTDPVTGKRVASLLFQLTQWAYADSAGDTVGPDTGFRFPDGARRSPDAAWFNARRWQEAQKPGERFPVFAPEFVVELRSPDDKLRSLREKMQAYIDSGVELAWLLDPIERTVSIYRPGRAPEILQNPARVPGEGPVAGFVLDLSRIFFDPQPLV